MVTPVLQRINMVESQVRPSDVTDKRIIAAMQDIPREIFAPPPLRALAYMDEPLPVTLAPSSQRAIMAPRVFAKLVQLLEISPSDRVLDVGAATGYSAAVLSKIAQSVVALESDASLADEATRNLTDIGIANITVVRGPLNEGHAGSGPYNAILLEGAVGEVPEALFAQLAPGGRLAAVVNEREGRRAVVWLRTEDTFAKRIAFDAAAPALPGFEKIPSFEF
jgi:protein-L-isoaspartate(D-aspartate) O-methyltransferase